MDYPLIFEKADILRSIEFHCSAISDRCLLLRAAWVKIVRIAKVLL